MPYVGLALACFWLSFFQWQFLMLIPAIAFLCIGAIVWSDMRHREIQAGGGRLPSRERLLELLPRQLEAGCTKARNLRLYRMASPVFWTGYSAAILVVFVETISNWA